MRKKCSSCRKNKLLSEFNKRKGTSDGLQYACKVCTRAFFKKHYDENRLVIIEQNKNRRSSMRKLFKDYKSTLQCKFCDENETVCLDFHHINDKEFDLAEALNLGFSWKRIKKEIDKCVCVCSNCHRKIHAGLLYP